VVSGAQREQLRTTLESEAETAFLQMPFTPAALAIKVRAVLDS
jgi:hypothetical protein